MLDLPFSQKFLNSIIKMSFVSCILSERKINPFILRSRYYLWNFYSLVNLQHFYLLIYIKDQRSPFSFMCNMSGLCFRNYFIAFCQFMFLNLCNILQNCGVYEFYERSTRRCQLQFIYILFIFSLRWLGSSLLSDLWE